MKKIINLLLVALLVLSGCSSNTEQNSTNDGETTIELSNDTILINGKENTTDSGIHIHNNIRYYEEEKGTEYGEGAEDDAHSIDEANEHTVIEINKPGTYRISGNIDKGQILIDLGDDSENDPSAVVNLILDNATITSTVAPAILVVNAYECAQEEVSDPQSVSTENAGFNLILATDSDNYINGSYVAKIYKEGTTDKLYKYDAAITSLISMNISEESANGKLTVIAENEGIESSMHLTINSGYLSISSGDDALNASEDNQSVMTINGGNIILNSALGVEGDGADSNGWIVINGGEIVANANPRSADSGLDADLGIYINGGSIVASGQMLDEISSESLQPYVVLSFSKLESDNSIVAMKDENGMWVLGFDLENYGYYVVSSSLLSEQDYTLYLVSSIEGDIDGGIYTNITAVENEIQLGYSGSIGNIGGNRHQGEMGNFDSDNIPEDGTMPSRPDGAGNEPPRDLEGEKVDGQFDGAGFNPEEMDFNGELNSIFTFSTSSNTFMGISIIE